MPLFASDVRLLFLLPFRLSLPRKRVRIKHGGPPCVYDRCARCRVSFALRARILRSFLKSQRFLINALFSLGDSFFSLRFSLSSCRFEWVAYPFTSIESPSARYFPFDICLEMAAVASAVNYRVADSKRLALQPHRFRFDIDRRASIVPFFSVLLSM